MKNVKLKISFTFFKDGRLKLSLKKEQWTFDSLSFQLIMQNQKFNDQKLPYKHCTE